MVRCVKLRKLLLPEAGSVTREVVVQDDKVDML